MALKVKRVTQRVIQSALAVVLLVLVACIGIVTYNEWQMSQNRPERKKIINNSATASQQEIDETVPTEQEVVEYVVPAEKPRYLSVTSLGITNARVREIGIDENGKLGAPTNIFDVAWYRGSALPGSGSGALLIDGHNGGPTLDGVFKKLNQLSEGAIITIERGDGARFSYRVAEKHIMTVAETDAYMAVMLTSISASKEGLNLITCTGNWVQAQQTYDQRVVIRAVRE
ncbi:MAG: class F sortase [Candidatus Nomurabacteria bacterium]|jgi:LPXTG-site transpeptidase (sortase) family protein|nr:class F sortase [Candidatus Nomurabacteria bacterium]